MPPEESSKFDSNDAELEQALVEVERSLLSLKERYAQVKQDEAKRVELEQRYSELLEQQKKGRTIDPIKTELNYIEKELENIEVNLESRLLSWTSFKEPFWQAVRFGGIGVVIGWLLKSCAG